MSSPNGSAPPTRLSLRAMHADALHRLLLSDRGASALSVQDIYGLDDLASWSRLVLDVAIGDLVHDGRLADDAYGRLIFQPLAEAAP